MKSKICIWNDLSLSDVRTLQLCETKDDIQKKLCAKFNYNFHDLQSKEKILIDLYFHTLLFARGKDYNEEQTSALFSIMKKTHEKAVETPFGNVDDTFSYFKDLLANHSVKRPPFSISLFPVQDVAAITEYVSNTYFKHFKLYKYAFTPKIVMNLSVKYADMPEEDTPDLGIIDGSVGEDEKDAGVDEAVPEPLEEEEDSPAIKELKQIIGSTLDQEIAKLRLNVEEKLKTNEENIMKQLSSAGTVPSQHEKRSNTKIGKRKGK